MKRVSTGISKMDRLIKGGFPINTTILLSGGPGTGKTLFGLNFLLEGAKKGEKCCYVSLNESKEDLIRACSGVGNLSKIEKYLDRNLAIESIPLGDKTAMKKFIKIIASYPQIDRLVIDNVNKLLIFSEDHEYRMRLSELLGHLSNMGCTMLLCETNNSSIDTGNGEAFETDGVIGLSFLEVEEKPSRIITIHKMRYTSFDPKIAHGFRIDSKGISLNDIKVI